MKTTPSVSNCNLNGRQNVTYSNLHLRRVSGSLFGVTIIAITALANAAVTEPDGLQVPNLAADGPSGNNETNLQQIFDQLGEPINAMADASPDPGVFSPMCDFSVEFLPLCQSQGSAGVAWYNVPSDPTAIPDKIYQLLPPAKCTNAPDAGTVISSAGIRNDVNYAGGLIGFVLTDNNGRTGPDGTVRIYYSEPERNDYCGSCQTPGYWIMMLAYKSKLPQYPNTYYLAFEDWLTTSSTSRGQTDCDFNDKIFRISGIQCQGGGEPCDTDKAGVCKPGLTACNIGTEIVCRQLVSESPERCDNVDNDCNGKVNDGDGLCPLGQVCDRGTCVGSCSQTEFPCPSNLVCDGTHCVEPACSAIDCPEGLVCRAGQCVDACSAVTCPIDQLCETGICVDPCKNVTCDTGTVCSGGACVASCGCAGCPAGKVCQADGSCVNDGCQTQSCGAGQVCVKGTCTDACAGAVCPGGAACVLGQCGAPLAGDGAGGATSTPVLGAAGVGNISTNDATSGASGANSTSSLGCGCRMLTSPRGSLGSVAIALMALFLRRRRDSNG